ncbi:RNA 2',3'-cyclic phosphodiesterase [Paenibacillus sp. DYY-L-2]|uniref:RNA 2',3'-cyclic phosphodiesterase n=1 Tax=Paenibacillus sp. DYY-L-2 TaxID=3447013 RepID=UPI003F5027F8
MTSIDNKENWRIFVAIPLPVQPVKEALAAWSAGMKDRLEFSKWVDSRDYHITVQFLGDTSAELVPEICDHLTEKTKGTGPIHLQAQGCGIFGRPALPRVLWAGVDGELSKLGNLQKIVAESNRKFGFVPEDRPYNPHITLARKYREGHRLPPGLLEKDRPEFGAWDADALVIYRTRMRHLPMYEEVGRIPL